MRIFIGIKMAEEITAVIHQKLKPLKKLSTPIRWVKPDNIHLSIKFIGEVSPEKCSEICHTLATTRLNIKPFKTNIYGWGKFGRKDQLNIFWAGLEQSSPLENLYHRVEDILAGISIERESREYTPHITLGRNKKLFNIKQVLFFIEKYSDQAISPLELDKFQVFQSELSSHGAMYSIKQEIPLD